MNGFGAVGRPSFCGRPSNFAHWSSICFMDGLRLKETKTAARWPSVTGTRMHWLVMIGSLTLTIFPPWTSPHIFMGSISLFSSSPRMKGITLSSISGQSLNVLPAPDMAWYVQTNTFSMPNSRKGWRAGT